MADGGFNFDVQDRQAVEAWKADAEKLNERAAKTVNEAAEILKEFRQTAEGNVFEQVCEFGEGVITGMTQVLAGMNEILSAVNKLIENILSVLGELVSGVSGTSNKVLG